MTLSPRSVRYLKQDSRTIKAYSDAKQSALKWCAQGMGDWGWQEAKEVVFVCVLYFFH